MGVTLRRGTRLVIASHNEGKVREIADLLAPFGVEAVSAGKLGLPEPEETGDSFVENARLKAAAAARDSRLPALADDSGLANFPCALALAAPDGKCEVFEGKVFGTITWPPRGARGFGYDPIFVPEGYKQTFGEMEPSLKDSISHRARAFEKLMLAAYDDD